MINSLFLQNCGIVKSSYYYKPVDDSLKKLTGMAASEFTFKKDGLKQHNLMVVNGIRQLLMKEFVDYSYLEIPYYLQDEKGYVISYKKVYRLMKAAGLLNKANPVYRW